MNTELLAKLRKRIEAKNGMAVTDQVWQLAHDYHRSHHQAHSLWGHGPGVVGGLHVSAQPDPNEPRQVWIKPGLAIDPEGNTVALHEEINFYVGADKVGPLYVVLKGRTDFPQARGNDVGKAPRYVEENYSINVADELTNDVIELARVNLSKRDSMINDAKNPDRPGLDEIDLRFRRIASVTTRPPVAVAICHLGEPSQDTIPLYGDAVVHLGRAFSHALGYPVFIDEMTSLQDAMHRYSLLCFVEHNDARISEDETRRLQAMLRVGGTLFVESYLLARQGKTAFQEILQAVNAQVPQLITPAHPLLMSPFPFYGPPPGADDNEADATSKKVWAGENIVFSTADYGRLWQRNVERRRESFRAAIEWGSNLVDYAAKRRQTLAQA